MERHWPGASERGRWAAFMHCRNYIFGVVLLLAFSIQLCLAGSAVQPDAIGEWSQSTNQIRGRLLFAELAPSKDGQRVGLVFLELQNLGETVNVYYDVVRWPPRCKLRDSAGKIVEQSPAGRDAAPQPCWLTLPAHSSIRLLTGYGPNVGPQTPSLTFGVGMDQTWMIPLNTTNNYSLSGTFTDAPSRGEGREPSWKGTLELPPVRIPVKSR